MPVTYAAPQLTMTFLFRSSQIPPQKREHRTLSLPTTASALLLHPTPSESFGSVLHIFIPLVLF